MATLIKVVHPKTVTHSTKTAMAAVVILNRAAKTKTVIVDNNAKQEYGLIHAIHKYQLISRPTASANDMIIV